MSEKKNAKVLKFEARVQRQRLLMYYEQIDFTLDASSFEEAAKRMKDHLNNEEAMKAAEWDIAQEKIFCTDPLIANLKQTCVESGEMRRVAVHDSDTASPPVSLTPPPSASPAPPSRNGFHGNNGTSDRFKRQ